jgi:vitamin B12 transporter
MKKSVPVFAAALLQLPLAALAQAASAPSTLNEIVVTANRTPQPLSDLVADVSVIDREQIERAGAVGVADLLARQPGIEITRNGGPTSTTSVFIRGAEQRFTAVYIDGVRVDSQSTGGAAWESIPLSQIERIEVLRGPAAAVYGSDAIGGVVQLFTKKGEGKPAPFLSYGIGSRGTQNTRAGVSGSAGALDYSIGASYEQSNGFDVRTPDVKHNPDADYYKTSSANVRLGYQINEKHRIDATVLEAETDTGYDASYDPKRPVDDRSRTHLRTTGLTWAAQWTPEYSTRLSVTDSSAHYETSVKPQLPNYITETQLRGYLFQNEYRLGAHLFSAALERREDKLDNPALDQYSTSIFRRRSQDALALGYGWHQGPHSLQVNLRHDHDSEFGGKTTGSAAYGYEFAKNWRVTASAGTAFRAPTLYQRFSAYGDASLQPESSRNAEIGVRYADATTSASLIAFRNRVRDLIVFDSSATSCGQVFGCYASVGRAEYKGVTLAGSQRFGDVTLRGSIDLQEPHDRETGLLLQRRARAHGSFGVDWQVAGWTLGAELQASGHRFDDAANKKRLGGYGLVNLSASTRLTPAWTLSARVDNVGNKDYQLASGYRTPGRTAYLNLKWAPI